MVVLTRGVRTTIGRHTNWKPTLALGLASPRLMVTCPPLRTKGNPRAPGHNRRGLRDCLHRLELDPRAGGSAEGEDAVDHPRRGAAGLLGRARLRWQCAPPRPGTAGRLFGRRVSWSW